MGSKINPRFTHATASRHSAHAVELTEALGGIDGIRLFHAERQPLSRQLAQREPVRRGYSRRDALCRRARLPLRLDRRASFQLAGRALLPRSDARLCRGAHQEDPPRPGGDGTAAAPPIRVAEQWASLDLLSGGRVDWAAGRGYDSREYAPFNISFAENQAIFNEGMEVVKKLWAGTGPVTHKGKYYSFENMVITPQPVQKPIPAYVASFSKPSIELAARLNCGLVVAPFAAAMSYGGLKQVADLYKETCLAAGNKPGRLICSYFAHFADNKEQEQAQRARQIRYYKECVIPAFPSDPKTAPPSYRYLVEMTERLHKVKAEDLTENSVLLGSAQQITDTLKKVEAAGFDEVILYFNVGLKPHQQVKDEMQRFAEEVRPAFR